ncbi:MULTISPECIES: MarR family winged helix-turn-helix transcriptional regulator [unclassified Terrabacter]|uniref:MarR family winged helix-turn-helix transcriptional regulator n=1 Tax=unclassified Terrabacter TaxID=2630222 RepID=UPI000700683C|nr:MULTISPECIES: MarR family transcriptional regulator [unclassified Terrabacter]KRB44020.1 MarR family transcriptional regulator [Terrabacter sp. Root181]KRF39551.1 MarR family transcriptional regulator [Terrabacter sp. Soil810]
MSPSSSTSAASSPLSLEQQICYAMHTTVRAFDAVYRELLSEHGLSYPQYIALMGVAEHGPLTVSRLGELMRLDSGTLSPLLKRMEAAGLVARTRDPEDERRVLVSATAAGRDRIGALGDVPHQIAVRSGLSRRELVDLHRTLRQVTERLDTGA